ncbi:MAG: hypothetical protein KatS3mg085_820 [Candidatus Dojkabacteria bacterium]|nr:MAG: hypothetical protein KatS3mg085_820 [Candidatus Dojkabacteria bacterium]GIW58789.1 MAG: hypothetical protein KatS3mg086_074 [Candidatus Dojkabacteria bacterium]
MDPKAILKFNQEEEAKKRALMQSIGMRIKEARIDKRISQLQLGVRLGVTDKTISGYESGRIAPPIDKLIKMAEIFKKPITYFLGAEAFEENIPHRLKALEMVLKDIKQEIANLKNVYKNSNKKN